MSSLSIAALEIRLAQAQATVDGFGQDYAQACLQAASGEQGGENRCGSIEAEQARAAQALNRAKLALAYAREQDALKTRAAREAVAKGQAQTVTKELKARDAAAKNLTTAIGNVAVHWKAFQDHSEAAAAANPINPTGKTQPWPDGALTAAGELALLVENEMARALAVAGTDNFPGIRHIDDAIGLAPMLPRIEAASAKTIETLQKRQKV